MKPSRALFVPVVASFFLAGAALAWSVAHSSTGGGAARLVRATISIDGQEVLMASTSDDGHPDADAVWSYLRTLEFRELEGFAALDIEPSAKAASFGWLRSKENEHLGPPPKIELDVSYGGWDKPFRLTILRTEGKDTWRVAPEIVERRFKYRRITRRQAAELDRPKRKK